jgi:hypothetical protein
VRASGGAGQQEVGDVHTRNQQDDADGDGENQERRPHGGDELVLEAIDLKAV